MAAFLRELAASQSVARAARSVGMGRQSAYKLRSRLAGTLFDEAWAMAREARRLGIAPRGPAGRGPGDRYR
jgi:hypothetical protein